jgi:two-component system, LuxR family, sensor kinase FixL
LGVCASRRRVAVTDLGRIDFAVFATAYFLAQVPILALALVLFRLSPSTHLKTPPGMERNMSQNVISCDDPNIEEVRDARRSGPTADDRSRLQDLLNERLRFETLLSRLSTTFIHLPAEDVDGLIERGLHQIVEFLGIDRSSLYQFSGNGDELVVTHSSATAGFAAFPRMNVAAMLPWYAAKLRRGEVLRFSRLPDELPPEAVNEREYCLRSGFRAHLVIPFHVGESIQGGLAFGSFSEQRDWPDDLVQSLRLVGQIFANALARKQSDLAVRASEERFRLMADTAPVMVWMSGRDKLCTYFNQDWLDFTGQAVERQLGNGWSAGVHPDDFERCLDTYLRAFDARQRFRMEYRLRRFDGQYRWILDTGVPRFEADGTFEGYIGSCVDINDQKEVAETLRETESRLRFLLESTQAFPWEADAQSWRFTYVGPQAAQQFGYPLDAWYGDHFWTDHLHPDDRDWAVAFFRERAQGSADFDFECRMLAAGGRVVWIHDIVHVVHEKGSPRMLRGFMLDVTARHHAEEETRSLRDQLAHVGRVSMMGELTASIAHEVNQPLCAIVSNAQALQRMLGAGVFDLEDVRAALRDITQDGQRASAVIARIRGFLQKASVQRSPVPINDLIREVAELVRTEMARRGVAVKLELADTPRPVLGDRIQIQQVILNLLANGADAMDRVPSNLRELVLGSSVDTEGTVTVAVTDAGIGLDPRAIGRVFDAFFTTKPGSLGMGLAICKSIVEAHGGRIEVIPRAGRGTTFQFTLPAAREAAP